MKNRLFLLIFLFVNFVFSFITQTGANGSTDGVSKPISLILFYGLMGFIIVCLILFYFILKKFMGDSIPISGKKFAIMAVLVVALNSVAMFVLYVEV